MVGGRRERGKAKLDLKISSYVNVFNRLAVGCGNISATAVLIEYPHFLIALCEG